MIIVGYIWLWLTLTQLVIPCYCSECQCSLSPGLQGQGHTATSSPGHLVTSQTRVFRQKMLKGLSTSIGPEVFMWPSQVDVCAKYFKYLMVALVTEGRDELTFRHHQMNLIKLFAFEILILAIGPIKMYLDPTKILRPEITCLCLCGLQGGWTN